VERVDREIRDSGNRKGERPRDRAAYEP